MGCSIAPALAASSPFDVQSFVGRWTCSSNSGGHTEKYAVVYSKANDKWIRYTENMPAAMGMPAQHEEAMLGSDDIRHQWVFLSTSSTGAYFVSTSNAAKDASTQVWKTAYPPDPTGASLTIDSWDLT